MSTVDRHKVPWDSETGENAFWWSWGELGSPPNSREEMVLKGHAEKREVKVCI